MSQYLHSVDQLRQLEPAKQQAIEAMRTNHGNQPTDRLEELCGQSETVADPEKRDAALAKLIEFVLRQDPSEEVLEKLEAKIDKIQSTTLRDRVWSLLKSREVTALIRTGSIDAAYDLSLKLPNALVRARALRDLSAAVAKRGSDTLRTSDLLGQALESLVKADASIERSQVMFKVVKDLANAKDDEKAFEALQFSSTSLGQLAINDFKEVPGAPISLFDYDGTYGKLAKVDFDKSLFLAQRIKWQEFRLAAEISTCRSILSRG